MESLKGNRDQKTVKAALDAWFHEVMRAEWKSPADVRISYRNASIVGPDRVVFNLKGNSYRLESSASAVSGAALEGSTAAA